jgi:transcription-repair coupling factor (superfamily II helicase)
MISSQNSGQSKEVNSKDIGDGNTTGLKQEGFSESWKCDIRRVLDFLRSSSESFVLKGVEPGALACLLAESSRGQRRSFLLVAPSDRDAEKYADMLSFFCGKIDHNPVSPLDRKIWVLPSRTSHNVQLLGKTESTAKRLEALYAMRAAPLSTIIVTSALALSERLIPPDILMENVEYRVPGEDMELESLCRRLVERGYYRVSLVEEYGDFSQRGGVLDAYAPLYRWPLRLEFFGDELESVRLFHPSSQRSMGTLDDFVLLPASEIIFDDSARERAQNAVYEAVRNEDLTVSAANVWLDKLQEGHQFGAFEAVFPIFFERTATLFDYLEPRTVVVWSDFEEVKRRIEEHYHRVTNEWKEKYTPHEWKSPPQGLFQDPASLFRKIDRFRNIKANAFADASSSWRVFDLGSRPQDDLTHAVRSHPQKERLFEPVARQFETWQQEGIRTYLVCRHKEQARRLHELLESYGVHSMTSDQPFGKESYDAPVVKVVVGSLEKGFLWEAERLALVSEEELFGKRPRRRSKKSVSGIILDSFQDLHVGDYVVHVDHGIGVYRELVHLKLRGMESDFLRLEYLDGDRLYVPVDKLQKVQKYLGVEGRDPRVDKLGGKSWEAAKKKARESAERIAEELLSLYAARSVGKGYQFSPPDQYFREFEANFAFEETEDQIRAIEDVLDDMASPRPMDRLICGDVGYGKTEVALRAAFKAVMEGKQVAILVPTTVLAEQHYQTFAERLEGFPVRVASLSRFKTQAQQKQVLEGLVSGTIDIVVGTHRLLQKDVKFKDLGLLIIDEEHRFGVKDKEKLKQLRVAVDVLTLTATPIPRTLQMSLAGIRDLSTIETPPQDRRAIETYVSRYDELTIREAIYKELIRGGQVFFVHNHVQTIYHMATMLGRLVPEARIAVAHGQMKERDLEKVMLDFIGRKTDVLVCTTIIESGLDIPAANTIVINRADKFGLAQIYQLRGRVGRSSEQAFAYLLVPGENLITRDAQKRLRALLDFSELGAGLKIALNDLQIRGGGTILGSAQSGHIAAVGYELYLELLEQTVNRMKGEKAETEAIDPEINIDISAFLPESYIADTDQRLLAYRRLATASDEVMVEDLVNEWRDRYGPLPENAGNLILLAKTRLLFKKVGVVRMDGDPEGCVLTFPPSAELPKLLIFLDDKKCSFSLLGDRKLRIEIWARDQSQQLERLKSILQEFWERVSDAKSIQ